MIALRKLLFLALLFSTSATIAKDVHTWHTVTAKQSAWEARLQMINQEGSFVSRDGKDLTTFEVDAQHPQEYGFIFDKGDNFDVAYTLTLTEKMPDNAKMFQSKACVFVISAKGPAIPDITALSYHGAVCDWKVVRGVGEDFSVS